MTFASSFGRVFSPTFQPSSQAAAVAAGGWWDLNGTITSCVAAWQAKGAASLAASYSDLSGNSHTITPGATEPSWNADEGWYAGDVLDTGVNGQTSDWTLVITISGLWITSDLIYSSKTKPRFGMTVNNAPQYIFMCISDNQRVYTSNVTSIRTVGLSGKYGYLNGTLVATDNGGTISGTPTIKIGPATTASGSKKRILAAAIYNRHLTADEHTALSTAMNAL